jgi:hypothetical protein
MITPLQVMPLGSRELVKLPVVYLGLGWERGKTRVIPQPKLRADQLENEHDSFHGHGWSSPV